MSVASKIVSYFLLIHLCSREISNLSNVSDSGLDTSDGDLSHSLDILPDMDYGNVFYKKWCCLKYVTLCSLC